MSNSSSRMPRLVLLDGLRGMAALAVMIFHCSTVRGQQSTFFALGSLAVDFFFILSGFVLTLAFEPKFANGLRTAAFMVARFKRLWPALTVGAVLGGLALCIDEPSLLIVPVVILTLLMVPIGESGSLLFFANPVQWSLALELIANFIHVAALHRLSDRMLHFVLLAFGLILAVEIWHFGTVRLGPMADTFVYGLPRAGFSYVLGIVIARHWRGESAQVSSSWLLTLCAPVAVIVCISILPAAYRPLWEALAVFLALPAVMIAATRSKAPASADAALGTLGAISYPLYATHYPVLTMVFALQERIAPGSSEAVWNIAGMLIAIGVAHLMAMAGIRIGSLRRRKLAAAMA